MAELTRAYIRKQRAKWMVAKVDTPEFGADGFVFVRTLPSSVYVDHADVFSDAEKSDKNSPADNMRILSKLCALGICSKDGVPLYKVDQAQELLDEWPGDVLQRCADKLIAFNGLGADVKTKAKNLPASRRGSSRSGSRTKSRKR